MSTKTFNIIKRIVEQPPELNLYLMEEGFVPFKIPFMQNQDLPCGRQKLVHGMVYYLNNAETKGIICQYTNCYNMVRNYEKY